MTEKSIHLVFKTHLDIGFTDHAAKVRQQYHDEFIPQAIATGEHFFAENPEQPEFIWTTGAWLIWDHLNSQAPERVQRLEQAIERGSSHGSSSVTISTRPSPNWIPMIGKMPSRRSTNSIWPPEVCLFPVP